MLEFCKSTYLQCENLFRKYLLSLSSDYDNYLEDHILASEFYSIIFEQEQIGYFSIHQCSLLTQFYIKHTKLKLAQAAFRQVIQFFHIRWAYVPTCDELFLSLAIEQNKKVEIQSYTFMDTDLPVEEAGYSRNNFKLLPKSEWESANQNSENFFVEMYSDKVKNGLMFEIYALYDNHDILGYGLREGQRIFTNCTATGMYTIPCHRQKGVGRSIILFLKQICYGDGKKPIPACWYYNENSKRTLESCGYTSKTRLLKIHF